MVELCQKTIKLKLKLNCAELMNLPEVVHMVILVLLHMVNKSSKKRNMFHLDIKQNYVNNTMKADSVHMVIDVNLFILLSLMKSSNLKMKTILKTLT